MATSGDAGGPKTISDKEQVVLPGATLLSSAPASASAEQIQSPLWEGHSISHFICCIYVSD